MKISIYNLLIICLSIISHSISAQPNPGGQSFVFYTSTPECEGSQNGKIRISISDNIPPTWNPPFPNRYENLDNGDVGDGVCDVGDTWLPNLTYGNYKVFVDLDPSCMAVGSVIIGEVADTRSNNK